VKNIKASILSIFQTRLTDFFRKNITDKKMPGNLMWKRVNTIQRTGSNPKKETSDEPSDFNLSNKTY